MGAISLQLDKDEDRYTKAPLSKVLNRDRPELRVGMARVLHKALRQFEVEKCPEAFYLKVHIDQIQALMPAEKEIRKQEMWVNAPTKRGDYWLSPFIEGKYISPRIISVIDYDRPDRGLEVQYDFPRDTIPVKTFCEEYYPKAKWMFITEPCWQALKGN